MSDYLSTLAARSLDVPPVVQPRLASWFEPPRLAAPPSAPDAVVPPPAAPRTAAEPATREIVVHHDRPSTVAEPRAFDERRTRVIPESIAHATDTRSRERETKIATPDTPVITPTSREPAPAIDTPRHSTIVEAGAVGSFTPRTPPQTLVVAVRPERRDRLDDRVAALEQRLGAPAPSSRTDSSSVTPADSRPPIHEPAIDAAPSRPTQPIAIEPAFTERRGPSVRVTIGRLEVRAVVPSSAPPQKASRRTPRAAAAPSLDEYLKQRGGGA